MTESSDAPSGGVGNSGGSVEAAMPSTDRPGRHTPAPPYSYRVGPYPPAPHPYWGFSAAPTNPKNGLGIASLVVAIVALVVSVTVVGGVVLGFVAVIFGLAAHARVRRGEATNGGVAMTGIVLGIVAAVIPLIIVVALVFGTDLFNGDYQRCIGYHPVHEKSCDRYR